MSHTQQKLFSPGQRKKPFNNTIIIVFNQSDEGLTNRWGRRDDEDSRGHLTSRGMEVGGWQPKVRTRRSTCFHKTDVFEYMMAKIYHR